MNDDLFAHDLSRPAWSERLGAGTMLLHAFALPSAASLLAGIETVTRVSPFRHMQTPGGQAMSVAMSNCGPLGWVTDRAGYRYVASDPENGQPWPPMPAGFFELAQSAASAGGFPDFAPDACLINRYAPRTRMALHQDRDERDFSAPIVSVSLGLPAVFLLGGMQRSDKAQRILLEHGDVLVWGGPDRLRFHGVMPVRAGSDARSEDCRINLTFRRAG